MAVIINAETCEGCGVCVDVCPMEALSMNGDSKAVVDADVCGDCGACIDECPTEAIKMP